MDTETARVEAWKAYADGDIRASYALNRLADELEAMEWLEIEPILVGA